MEVIHNRPQNTLISDGPPSSLKTLQGSGVSLAGYPSQTIIQIVLNTRVQYK